MGPKSRLENAVWENHPVGLTEESGIDKQHTRHAGFAQHWFISAKKVVKLTLSIWANTVFY